MFKKSYEIEGFVVDCETFVCHSCSYLYADKGELSPVFAGSEWDIRPICAECGAELDVILIEEEV